MKAEEKHLQHFYPDSLDPINLEEYGISDNFRYLWHKYTDPQQCLLPLGVNEGNRHLWDAIPVILNSSEYFFLLSSYFYLQHTSTGETAKQRSTNGIENCRLNNRFPQRKIKILLLKYQWRNLVFKMRKTH